MLDAKDKRILEIMRNNARITNADVARELKMAPSAVLERVRKLESKGILQGYSAKINPESLDLTLLAFCSVSVATANWSDDVSNGLKEIPNILEIHEVAGKASYMVKIRARDMEDLSDILKMIGKIKDVSQTYSDIVLHTLQEESALPVL